jgi:hypothetical protein
MESRPACATRVHSFIYPLDEMNEYLYSTHGQSPWTTFWNERGEHDATGVFTTWYAMNLGCPPGQPSAIGRSSMV